MTRNVKYVKISGNLTGEWYLDEMLEVLEGFVSSLYGYDDMKDVNLLRYKLSCAKKGNGPRFELPPCRWSLRQHCLHANYQSKICRDYIADESFVPSLDGRGWVITSSEIYITWMDCNAAPMRYTNFSITE